MSVTTDILRSYLSPRLVMRRKLAAGPREDRAMATLMGACLLSFVAQWPGLARASFLDPSVPLDARIGGALLGAVFMMPILAYAMAGISRLVARVLGGHGTGYGSRIALFWAFLAVSPLMLLQGLVGGFIGAGPADTAVRLVVLAAFLFLWINNLIEAERPAVET